MKNYRGNITILVLFILIASSLMGLLSMYFVRQLAGYSGLIHNHYKTYYLSKAGLELGLVEANIRGIGFNNSAGTGDSIVLDNFDCEGCSFEMDLIGKVEYLSDKFWLGTGCNTGNAFVLSKGETLALPLFVEYDVSSHKLAFGDVSIDGSLISNINDSYDKIIFEIIDNVPSIDMNFGILVLDNSDNLYEYGYYFQTKTIKDNIINEFLIEYKNLNIGVPFTPGFKQYLLIANPNDDNVNFCLKTNSAKFGGKTYMLATQRYYIRSMGNYFDNSLSLEATYRQPLPSFLLDTVGGFS